MHQPPNDPFEYARYVRTLDEEQLSKLRDDLAISITQIHIQIDLRNGTASPEWLHKAQTKLRYMAWRHKTIENQINKLKREEYFKIQQTFEHRFLIKAKELLDPDTFGVIKQAAEEAMPVSNNVPQL